MSERDLNDSDLDHLADELRRLSSVPPRLDRDRLFFEAGRASAPRSWPWQVGTAASLLASLVLAIVLFVRPPHTVERVVHVPAPSVSATPTVALPESRSDQPAGDSPSSGPAFLAPSTRYQQMQEHLLRWGLDGVDPPPPAHPAAPATLRGLLDSL
jgi:hypothetical protein